MLWTEIKKWSKGLGYDTIKNKDDGKYYWKQSDSDDINNCGVAASVSKLAKAVYNHYTNNQWVDHQDQFLQNKEEKRIALTDYGT